MRKPEILCIAGPNGSGKSTITCNILPYAHGKYINADEIQKVTFCSSLEAAQRAEMLRENCLKNKEDFVFETVLSTERNLNLLKRAKEQGYFIRCVFVLTCNPEINVSRVRNRVLTGGHDVPVEKIISRYKRSLDMLKELIPICDRLSIYDNSKEIYRIYKKKNDDESFWENKYWNQEQIKKLTKY